MEFLKYSDILRSAVLQWIHCTCTCVWYLMVILRHHSVYIEFRGFVFSRDKYHSLSRAMYSEINTARSKLNKNLSEYIKWWVVSTFLTNSGRLKIFHSLRILGMRLPLGPPVLSILSKGTPSRFLRHTTYIEVLFQFRSSKVTCKRKCLKIGAPRHYWEMRMMIYMWLYICIIRSTRQAATADANWNLVRGF